MKFSRVLQIAILLLLTEGLSLPAAAQSSALVLRSGAGAIGSEDTAVWVQGSPALSPRVPSSGLSRQHPFIVAPPSVWSDVAGAGWVSPSPNWRGAPGSYEYFSEFALPRDVASARLDMVWRGDDRVWPGLNGVRLPGAATFASAEPPGVLHFDVSTLVRGGTNRLSFFVENIDLGPNATGLAFVAILSFTQGGTPIPSYTLTDLGTLGGSASETYAMNAAGQSVGYARTTGGAMHAFLADGGVLRDLGTLGGTTSRAFAINAAGHVVGWSLLASEAPQHAFLYRDGRMIDLGTLGGTDSGAYGINAIGEIVGNAHVPGDRTYQGFLYSGGVMRDLGTLGGGFSTALGITDAGQVVGWADIPAGTKRAFLYQGGVMRDLGTLGGFDSGANFMHANGDIVGWSRILGNASVHAFVYRNGRMLDVGTLGGTHSEAFGVNASGQVVGAAAIAVTDAVNAFISVNGTTRNLTALIPPESGWELIFAFNTNDAGQIVGRGRLNGQDRAYLLTPIPGT